MEPTFGLTFTQIDDQPIPVIGANMDVIGIVGPCSTANNTVFPLNVPVLVFSNDTTTLAELGDDGYIADAVNAINDQLGVFQVAAQLVIVVTPYGTNGNANLQLQQTIAHVMGDSISRTGVWALLDAPNTLYCTPRVILCPGYTGQMANSLDEITVTVEGIGYEPGQTYQVTFGPGEGETNNATLVLPQAVAVADEFGYINTDNLTITSYGAWFTVNPTAAVPLPDGPAVTGSPASGQLIFSRTPGIGATLTLNGSVVTFVSATASGAVTSGPTLTGGTVSVAASGWIGFQTVNPQPGDTITLNGTVVTFVASGATGSQVNVGVNIGATLTALDTFLNASADTQIAKCSYSVTGDTLNIGFKTTGTAGNAFTIGTNITLFGNFVHIASDNGLNTTLTNLVTFLSNSTDTNIEENTYTLLNGIINIVQKTNGTAGNAYTLASIISGLTLSGATLTGGQNAAESTQAVLVATMALGANPVCATLGGGVLNSLMGNAWVESAGISLIDDENWRDTLDSERLIPNSGGVKIQDPVSGEIIAMPCAPRIAGLQIATDFARGFPFNSAANSPVNGIVGPLRTIEFSLTDGAVEGQQLLAANIGIIVRGEIGVESAISSGGFVYIGTDNAGSDPLWQMYNVVRGSDYIQLSLMPALRVFLGQSNIDAQTVMNILNTISGFLGQLMALQQILGYTTSFSGALNSASSIRLGHLTVGYAAEPPPVLKVINTQVARYAPAINALVASLEQQLNLNT